MEQTFEPGHFSLNLIFLFMRHSFLGVLEGIVSLIHNIIDCFVIIL